jgi:hypothetical protein
MSLVQCTGPYIHYVKWLKSMLEGSLFPGLGVGVSRRNEGEGVEAADIPCPPTHIQ